MTKKIAKKVRKNHDDKIITRGILKKEIHEELSKLREELPSKNDLIRWKNELKNDLLDWKDEIKREMLIWKDEVVTIMHNERLEDTNVRGAHQRYEKNFEEHETRLVALEGQQNSASLS